MSSGDDPNTVRPWRQIQANSAAQAAPSDLMPRRPARKNDHIGAHSSRHYCECGAKKRNGTCPRCEP